MVYKHCSLSVPLAVLTTVSRVMMTQIHNTIFKCAAYLLKPKLKT